MPRFAVLLHGTHFFFDLGDGPTASGFYVQRIVEARDAAEAETRAVERLRRDATLIKMTLNQPSDPPMVYAEEIRELTEEDGLDQETGFAFYTGDAEEASGEGAV
ncbi:MAG: hypothetical protein ACE5G0_00585 [Rhodothermales bacterium]